MAIIRLPLLYVSSKGEKTLLTAFDNVANLSCIHPDHIKDLETPVRLGRVRQLITIGTRQYIDIREAVALDFYINDILLSDEFLLVPGLDEEAIIGDATMRKWRIKLDVDHHRVIVDPKVAELRI
jgi:hypothetical protein